MEEKPRFIQFVGRISNYIVVIVPLAWFLYFLWIQFTKSIYFAGYSNLTCMWGIVILIGLILYFPALILAKIQQGYRMFFLILMIMSFCLSIIPALYRPTIISTAKRGSVTYNLIEYDSIFDAKIMHYLVRCWSYSLTCEKISPVFNVSGASSWPAELIYDDVADELHVFIRGGLVYTYGKTSRSYSWEDSASIGESDYDLYSFPMEGKIYFRLAKCNRTTMLSCEILPFDYTTPTHLHGNLIVSNDMQELLILFDGFVYYAFGNLSRQYEYLSTVESPNNLTYPRDYPDPTIYSLSAYEDSGIYRYLLVECNAPFGWCELLPVRLTSDGLKNAELSMNAENTELWLFFGEKLVFKYTEGAMSRCYVEGCEIIPPAP